ncbi:thioredoxin reductase [Leeuwenhoekiella aestuarii]|uniref:Thioredoxin reductase n=1 Tax=Leeuwenhoekiella aestuarii TaxID=2249426 RepID=A0A4V1KNN3_9FLAO|nr:NAD(P)/FAD-dependent oxidoreductase [Leeuwenhoekiella aestuarii]RXG11223.1 thioredoxin reductase [Leeuwenhoekiella aestuarii]RXG11589.1 thioredoxin reductase [Leeuwenhoekiella aestuarii]
MYKSTYDVIIIGGSYSGLSAAMALGRSLRSVLILDGGNPCNWQTPHSHNFITQDGEQPHRIAQKAKEQVLSYKNVDFLEDYALLGKKTAAGFEILTEACKTFRSRKLLFATGIKDIMPDIEGFAECWGISAIHCPYCHGYEFKSEKTAILANGEQAFHMAGLVRNLTNNLSILTQGKPDFNDEQVSKLHKNEIRIIETPAVSLAHENGQLETLRFEDGSFLELKALYAALPFEQHSNIPEKLGCTLTESGHIEVDHFQKTSVPGIYACGDNTSRMRSVAYAVAAGNVAGAMINHELTLEDF